MANTQKTDTRRYIVLIAVLVLVLFVLLWRVVDLTVLDKNFLQSQGDARSVRIIDMPAYRGMITDRNNKPLAVSTPVTTLWVNPQEFSIENAQGLLKQLKLDPIQTAERLAQYRDKEFMYLQRGLNPAEVKFLDNQSIPGLHSQREFRRFYPEGEVAAHILGFTNIDDQGQEGIELFYDKYLKGTPGKQKVVRDRLGNIVATLGILNESHPGKNIALSIDRRIQFLTYRALKKAVTKNKAKSGSAVVLDAQTGEILAMVNQPSYNPNQRHKIPSDALRNRAITDLFEPGSVIKPFAVASAMANGDYQSDSIINTHPGWMLVDGNMIKDYRNYGELTVEQILKKSSNIGVTKLTLSQPIDYYYNLLKQLGFGERTGVEFPGEVMGSLVNHRTWRPFVHATLAFGYGLSTTTLQLAQAYSVLANQGELQPVTLIHGGETPARKSVLSPEVCQSVLKVLTSVVEEQGTGRRAKIPHYTVAGKTGTARIAGGPDGYYKDRHVATFVGLAPASAPRLVVSVMINEPRNKQYYGGLIAAPLFAEIMSGALKTLNIKPDKTA